MIISNNSTIHLKDFSEKNLVLDIQPNLEITVIDYGECENVTVLAGENSRVKYFYLAAQDIQQHKLANLEKDAHITWCSALMGGKNQQEIVTQHLGTGAQSNHYGICLGTGHDRFVMNYWNEHTAEHTAGHILVHAVMFDHSYADFKGNIKIKQTAHDTAATLTEETILLGDHSRSDSIPQLEIATNDVKAAHSSAITKIDDEQLFYLQSRGIEREEAKRLIVRGFLEDIVQQWGMETQQTEILQLIEADLAP